MASTQEEAATKPQTNVLCVGLTVVDLISTVERFPKEDSDQRGLSFRKQRGGNASNACTVLRQLSTPCEYLGVLPPPSDAEHEWLREDFDSHGIKITGCVYSDTPCPVATVLVSRETGSRTIVFCDNGHPELSHQQFISAVADRLLSFSWVHFELRPNVDDCIRMLEVVNEKRQVLTKTRSAVQHPEQPGPQPPPPPLLWPRISVEVEKPDQLNAELAMALADVVFISKDWARSHGWADMQCAARHAGELCQPHATVVCPWAEEGAAAFHDSKVFTAAATPPSQVVDTLGAGDTFVGAFIHHCCCLGGPQHQGALHLPQSALDFACRLAACKCTLDGFEGLHKFTDPPFQS